MKFEAGQKLWFVPAQKYNGEPKEVEIARVGRKWLILSSHNMRHGSRVDMNNLYLDGHGYSSPGRCYLSKETWEAEQKMESTWYEFKELVRIQCTAKKGVTVEDIQKCKEILKLGE